MYKAKRTFFSASLSIILTTIVFYFIGRLISVDLPSDFSTSIKEIFSVDPASFLPEPTEKRIFFISVIGFPIVMSFLYLISDKVFLKFEILSSKTVYYIVFALNTFIIIYLLYSYTTQSGNVFFINNSFIKESPILFVAIIIFIMMMKFFLKRKEIEKLIFHNAFNEKINMIIKWIVILYIIFVGFSNILTINSFNDSAQYTSHFNAVFHSVSQVYLGKSMLVDLTNQYGLYPHILEPIFKLMGLNVFTFTLVMSLLISLSFYCIFKVLDKLILNKYICLLAFSFVLYYGYIHFRLISPDPYYQYYPIRTLFPALLLYLSLKFFEGKSSWKYYLFTLIFSLAVLWNMDTGIIVFLTWVLALIFDDALNWKGLSLFCKSCLKHFLVSLAGLAMVLLTFSLFVYLRSGVMPDYIKFFNYQTYFYGFGFFMLPMKMIHPWNLVILMYIIGLIISLSSIIQKVNTLQVRLIFILSILGVGLFTYYQGRSHDHVLTLTWYPALMLLVIYIYMLYCQVKKKNNEVGKRYWLLYSTLFLFIILIGSSLLSLVKNTNNIYHLFESRWSLVFDKTETPVTSGINFIKENTIEGEKILILSYHSGVDYLYSKTMPIIDIPGMSELFLIKEYNLINTAINKNSSLKKVFIDVNFLTNAQQNYQANLKVMKALYDNFEIIDKSPYDNMVLLNRKSEGVSSNSVLLPNRQNDIHYLISNNFFVTKPFNDGIVGMKEYLPAVSLSQEFTIEVILKPDKVQKPYGIIIGNHPGDGFQGFVIQQENNNQNVYSFNYGNGNQWAPPLKFSLVPNEWSYITVVFNKGKTNIYINGFLETSELSLEHFENSQLPLSIGNWMNMDRGFNGIISEVRISNGVLLDREISDNWKGMIDHLPDL
ncbi:LamG domain-containing protein [Paenibacillus sp. FSL M7-0420]|uniref:LamG domain-containing protein n=1 Tax=Paenibacillus sp. FSL M7-0420 TaxID=2921609 RepID=UPI0030FB8B9D